MLGRGFTSHSAARAVVASRLPPCASFGKSARCDEWIFACIAGICMQAHVPGDGCYGSAGKARSMASGQTSPLWIPPSPRASTKQDDCVVDAVLAAFDPTKCVPVPLLSVIQSVLPTFGQPPHPRAAASAVSSHLPRAPARHTSAKDILCGAQPGSTE